MISRPISSAGLRRSTLLRACILKYTRLIRCYPKKRILFTGAAGLFGANSDRTALPESGFLETSPINILHFTTRTLHGASSTKRSVVLPIRRL